MLFNLYIPIFYGSSLIPFILNLKAKSIDLVLSLSKCILSLVSTNQSHILQNSSFNYLYAGRQLIYHQQREKDHI